MGDSPRDRDILRALAGQLAARAADPVMTQRREQWRALNSLRMERPMVLATFGVWNHWCTSYFADSTLECSDPFCRGHERALRMAAFRETFGDDEVVEPWYSIGADVTSSWTAFWGMETGQHNSDMAGGAWKYEPPLQEWADVKKLVAPVHVLNEETTAAHRARVEALFGDILPVNVVRTPAASGFPADISTFLARLRGLEQIMIDMYESPDELHGLLAFMRDGILANQAAGEAAGDFGLTSGANQSIVYCDELKDPAPNVRNVRRAELWGFMAAQEYTLVSPDMHDEFLLQYQKPIMEAFGLSHYGCCENLTRKIDMLRQVRNLRSIAVTPVADVAACAEQIGGDYVASWRPNPTDMVSCGFDEGRIRKIIGEGIAAMKASGVSFHILLKDVETVEDDVSRFRRWVEIVHDEIDKAF